jgi:hypothetical protein
VKRFVIGSSALALAFAFVLSCTSGEDVYITSKSNSALKKPELCCTEFRVGATVDDAIAGGATARVAVQAVATFAGLAAANVDDMIAVCRALAEDLDVPLAVRMSSETEDDKRARMKAFCNVAASAITAARDRAGGTLSVQITRPICATSVRERAACQSRCSEGAACDAVAHPPQCSSGRLTEACSGACIPTGGAPMTCTGSCSGVCTGACLAPTGVACAGLCDGLCKGASEGGEGLGIQPDGTCSGTCLGMCRNAAPSAHCSGTCTGTCDAACTDPAGASVTCDGACSGPFEALACVGGKLTGGCSVEPACDQSCDALAAATLQCTPARVIVAANGAANDARTFQLTSALIQHLPVLLAVEARLNVGAAQTLVAMATEGDSVTQIKAACIPSVISAAANTFSDVSSAEAAATSVLKAVTP